MEMSMKKRKMLKVALLAVLSAGIAVGMTDSVSAHYPNGSKKDGDYYGDGACVYGDYSSAWGDVVKAYGNYALAAGSHTYAYEKATALGSYATAEGTNSVALGYGTTADEDSTVAVGNRRIVQVAEGEKDNDAVTMKQLRDRTITVKYDKNGKIIAQKHVFAANDPTWEMTNGEEDETKQQVLARLTIKNGVVASGDTGYTSGGTMYSELRAPIAVKYVYSGETGSFAKYKDWSTPYISDTATTGDNLKTLAYEVRDLDDHFEWSDGKATNDLTSKWIWGGFQDSDHTVSGTEVASYGINNIASGTYLTAVGSLNTAYGTSATAIGRNNKAGVKAADKVEATTNTTAVGTSNQAKGDNSSAYGYANQASGLNSVALGSENEALNSNSTAVGVSSTASGSDATAVGSSSKAEGTQSVAIGYKNTASNSYSTAMGVNSTATEQNATAVGSSAHATGTYAAAYGYNSTASGTSSIAVGNTAVANNTSAVAVGTNATATGINALAFGEKSSAAGEGSIALGSESSTKDTETYVVSVGGSKTDNSGTLTRRIIHVADGIDMQDAATVHQLPQSDQDLTFNSDDKKRSQSIITNDGKTIATITIEKGTIAENNKGFVDGNTVYQYINENALSIVDFNHNYALQNDHWLSTDYGLTGLTKGVDSAAYGYKAQAMADQSVAIGYNAVVETSESGTSKGAIALGAGSVVGADDGNVLSIGGAMEENPDTGELSKVTRRITNVSAGTTNTDAANVGQLLAKANVTLKGDQNTAVLKDRDGNDVVTITVQGLAGEDGEVDQIVEWSDAKHWLSTDFDKTFDTKGENSVAYGYGANAQADNSVAIGAGSVATVANTFSVGSVDSTRRIVNVSAGKDLTDAANVSQLVKTGQFINADNNKIYANDGKTVLATISGLGGSGSGSGDGGIVDYDTSYPDTDAVGDYSHHYLSTDFGKKTTTTHGNNSAAYGYKANAKAEDSVAIGTNALATGIKTVAIGAESVATGKDESGNPFKDTDGNSLREISFGHKAGDTAADGTVYDTDLKSKLTNIAYGTDNNDVATVGQILADGQELSLVRTVKPETGDDTRTNVLRANDGTVLATLEKGSVNEISTGFVSGADVYAADVKVQTIDAANNKIKNNAGKDLVTISVATDTSSDGNSFITKNYYESTVNQAISDASIVNFDSDYKAKESSYLSTDFGQTIEHGTNSAAYGYKARALGAQSVVIGSSSAAYDKDAVVIGANATANGEGSVAIGAGSKANGAYEVSFGVGFGDDQFTRKLTNVTKGTDLTDAATVSQITKTDSKVSFSKMDNTDETKNSNVLLSNGGTLLATFQKGEIEEKDGGFASGGDVWLSDVKEGQILSGYKSSGDSDETVATEGSTQIVNNEGQILFSVKVASSGSVDKQGNGFVTEKYYYDTIGDLVQDSGIIDYDPDYGTSGKHWLATGFDKTLSHGDDTTAYGYNAVATGTNSVAIGANSVASTNNTFSVGDATTGLLRKITNVAGGLSTSDAATFGQILANGQNVSITGASGSTTLKDNNNNDLLTISWQNLGGSGESGSSIVKWDEGQQWITTSYDKTAGDKEPGQQSTAYGYGAKATGYGSVAIGYGSIAEQDNVFSVGGTRIETQVEDDEGNLAYTYTDSGKKETTVYQDKDDNSKYYDAEGNTTTVDLINGSLTKIMTTTGSATRRIVNVTDGEEDSDAATFGQIVKKGQTISATKNQVVDNRGDVLFTIDGLNTEGGAIVKYDSAYGTSGDHWLSTDFDKSITKGKDSAAYGYGATAKGAESVAIGKNAYADGEGSIAIGSGSVAHTGTDGISEISFGHAAGDTDSAGNTYNTPLKRRLANVESGVKSGDVATWDQVVEVGQTLYASTADREDDADSTATAKEKKQNVLYNNNGDALATLSIGGVEAGSTGFVSGGDVYDAIAAQDQLVTLSTALREEEDKTKGQGNQIVTNDGTVLATFKATDTAKDDTYNADAFVTTDYLNEKIYKDSIVDYDKDYGTTTGTEEGSDLVVHDDYWLSTDFGKASATTHGKNSAAYGYKANAKGEKSVAVGAGATATGTSSVALGNNAQALYDNAMALGAGATANQAGAIAIGQGSIANAADEVSFGDPNTVSTWRKLVNVADGVKTGDAATWGQIAADGQAVTLSGSIRKNSDSKTTKENEIAANDGTVLATFTRMTAVDTNDYGFVAGKDLYGETREAIAVRETEAVGDLENTSLQLHYITSGNTAAQNLIALDRQVYTNYSDIQKLRDLSNLTDAGDKYIVEKAKTAVTVEGGSGIAVRKITDSNTGTATYRVSTNNSSGGDGRSRQSNLMQANLFAANSINLAANDLTANNTVSYEDNANDAGSGMNRVVLYEYEELKEKFDPNDDLWTNKLYDSPLYDATNYANWIVKSTGKTSFAIGNYVLASGDRATAVGESTIASGLYSAAFGNDSVATEEGEVSFGHDVGDINRRSSLMEGSLNSVDGSITTATVKYTKELNRRLTHVAAGYNDTDVVNFSQVKVEAQTYTGDNAGTTYLTSSATTDSEGTITLNDTGTVGKNLQALDAKAVQRDQNLTISSSTSGTLYANDGTALATISVTGLNASKPIVDYDANYATADNPDYWLSTDFDKESVTHGKDSAAYGYGANAKGAESVAIGKNAYADGEGSIAIGADSVAHTTEEDGNKIEEISFGHAKGDTAADGTEYSDDLKRKLTNVAYGTDDNDVATVGQIVAAGQNVTLSTTARNASDATKGKGNEIVANDGTVLATFTKGSVTSGDTNFVSGGDVYAADVASKEVNLSTTGNKVYTNGNSTTPLLTFTGKIGRAHV